MRSVSKGRGSSLLVFTATSGGASWYGFVTQPSWLMSPAAWWSRRPTARCRCAAVPMDAETRCAVFIAEGLGHAFVTLSDEATVLYMCSTPYAPARERGVHPLDPGIGIAWPADLPAILSDKDAAAPSLAEARAGGLLPAYQDCLAHA